MNIFNQTKLKSIFLLAFAALYLYNAPETQGQEWATKMFDEFKHDFGNVPKGEVPEYRFEIQNVYEEDIQIAGVYSSCGCTSVSLSKKVLKTWEKAEVICRFNSPAFDGFKQATVTVRFERPYAGEVQLTVQGNIVRGLTITPDSINFGQVTLSDLPIKIVQLASSGTPPIQILDVKSTFPHIKVQLKKVSQTPQLIKYEMETQLKDSVPMGFSQGELYVVVDEHGTIREIPVKFTAKVASSLQLPEMITMGSVAPGEEVKKRVILKSDEPFAITDVTCRSTAFRVKADSQEKKVHFVEISYTGEETPGQHESELSFYINSGKEPAGTCKTVVEILPEKKEAETNPETAGSGSSQPN